MSEKTFYKLEAVKKMEFQPIIESYEDSIDTIDFIGYQTAR